MAVNPLIALGSLNRLRGSVVIPSYPTLNVTASFLSKRGIRMDLVGDATQQLEAMTGVIPSPEPYMVVDVTVSLLKTNGLAAAWIAQLQLNSVLGNVTVHTDTSAYPAFNFSQCAITRLPPESFSGDEPNADFTFRGQYIVNNNLWALA